MISLDISLVWVIINLLVLYLLLKKFLFKPVCKMMDERSAKIQSDLDGAAQAKADAEKIKADYEAEIADAHSQAVEITNKAKAQAGRECDLMLENARAESAKIMKEAEKSIANERLWTTQNTRSQTLLYWRLLRSLRKMWEATPTEKLLMNFSPR